MDVSVICPQLQDLQREKQTVLRSRIRQENRLRAVVAGRLGYKAALERPEREKMFEAADRLIGQIAEAGEKGPGHPLKEFVLASMLSVVALDKLVRPLEKQMERLAAQLPAAAWVARKEQDGFGLPSLATVVGECGDLANYPGPRALWRRMGCMPYTHGGLTLMGSSWRAGKHGHLPDEAWEDYGYSPRRRSAAYLIGENLMRRNGKGPYRQRYDESKASIKEQHPDYPDQRCHRHGMLLAAKLLLKNLWKEWNHR